MNTEARMTDKKRIHPTAAFTLTVAMIAWIDQEAKRRGVSKSQVIREILSSAMDNQGETAVAA